MEETTKREGGGIFLLTPERTRRRRTNFSQITGEWKDPREHCDYLLDKY